MARADLFLFEVDFSNKVIEWTICSVGYLMLSQGIEARLEEARFDQIIRIKQQSSFGRREGQSRVSRSRGARVFLVQDSNIGEVPPDSFNPVVGGGIINNNDFQTNSRVKIGSQRLEGEANQIRSVVKWNDHRDVGLFHWFRPALAACFPASLPLRVVVMAPAIVSPSN
jgi:hypothetical protein